MSGELEELKEMEKTCEDSRQQMGLLSHDTNHLRTTTAAGDQPSAATSSSAAAGGFPADGGTSGVAGGAAPSKQEDEGTGGSGFAELSLLRRLVSRNPYSRPPHLPRDPERQVAWYRDLHLWLVNEGLEEILTVNAATGPVCVINSSRSLLLSQHPENVVDEHFRAWRVISASVAGSDLQERLMACATVAEAWSSLKSWVLPTTRAEIQLLEMELNNVPYDPGEPPKMFFAKIDKILNTLRLVGVEKTPEQILQVMFDQLPPQFRVEKAFLRMKPDTTRQLVERTISDAYATARRERILQQSTAPATPAAPNAPHALFVGGFQSGRWGGGGRRRRRGSRRRGRRFGYGWQGDTGRTHGEMGLGQWQLPPRRRYRFEGHCGYCGQWGHMKRDCILARNFRAQRNGLVQPHVNVVAPGCSFDGFVGMDCATWEDRWADDVPWQGPPEGATVPCNVGTPAYGGHYAHLPPQPESNPAQQQQTCGVPAWSTPEYWNEPPHGSDQRGDDGGDDAGDGSGMDCAPGMLACAFADGVEEEMREARERFQSVQRGASQPTRMSVTPTSVAATRGESAPAAALVGGAAGQPARSAGETSATSAAAVSGCRVSLAGLAERTARTSAPPAEVGVSDDEGDLREGADEAGGAGAGGADSAGATGELTKTRFKTNTAPTPDPMPPDLNDCPGDLR